MWLALEQEIPVTGIFIPASTGREPGKVTWPNVEKGTVYKGHPYGVVRREGRRGEVLDWG